MKKINVYINKVSITDRDYIDKYTYINSIKSYGRFINQNIFGLLIFKKI